MEVRVPVASPVLSPFLSVITNVAQPVDWLYYFFVLSSGDSLRCRDDIILGRLTQYLTSNILELRYSCSSTFVDI